MNGSLHPEAEQDVADALNFYAERAGAVVAGRFLSEFERVAELLTRHPGFGTPVRRNQPPRTPSRTMPNPRVSSPLARGCGVGQRLRAIDLRLGKLDVYVRDRLATAPIR